MSMFLSWTAIRKSLSTAIALGGAAVLLAGVVGCGKQPPPVEQKPAPQEKAAPAEKAPVPAKMAPEQAKPAQASPNPELAKLSVLATKSVQAYEKKNVINNEMKAELGVLPEKKRAFDLALRQLAKPFDAKKLAELEKALASVEKRLADSKKIKNISPQTLTYRESKVIRARIERDAAAIKDADARAAKKKEIESEKSKLTAEIKKISAPFNERIDIVKKGLAEDKDEFKVLLSKYFRAPTGDYQGGKCEDLNVTMHDAFMNTSWKTADNKSLAWTHVRLRSNAERDGDKGQKKLNDKFPIRSSGKNSIWLWAGNFLICFVPSEDGLKNEEKLQKAVTEYIDLDGLAQIKIKD